MTRHLVILLLSGATALPLCGCHGSTPESHRYTVLADADAERGRHLVADYHCGACHTIPRVRGARGVVAAPLTNFAARTFIAGEVPNTPQNLERWIRNPRDIEPNTAMPALGLSQRDAHDVAAFLYELR